MESLGGPVLCGHSGLQANRGSAMYNTELPKLLWVVASSQQWEKRENGVLFKRFLWSVGQAW